MKNKNNKKIHRFFLTEIPELTEFIITNPALLHQLIKVLRYKEGEELIFFSNGSDDFLVQIKEINKNQINFIKKMVIPARPKPIRNVIAAISIIKKDLFELVVQKLTELGVAVIVPIVSERTIKQSIRQERLEQISLEALEQSGGNTKVQITSPVTLTQCLERFPFPSVVFDMVYSDKKIDVTKDQVIIMYIGPEGGWTENEKNIFQKYSVLNKSLGYNVLRAETAAIVGAFSLLQ